MSMIDKAKLQLTKCAKCVGCSRLDDDSFRGDDGCMQFKAAKPDIEAMKRTYNDILVRMKKGEKYQDSPNVSQEDKDKQETRFKELVKQWNDLLTQIEKAGHLPTDKEILEGFK